MERAWEESVLHARSTGISRRVPRELRELNGGGAPRIVGTQNYRCAALTCGRQGSILHGRAFQFASNRRKA